MEVLRTTSCLSLIQSIGTRFRINNTNWHGDAIDWMGEAIQSIGYHTGFESTEIKLEVNNFRVKVPSKVVSLNYIYYNGLPLPVAHDRSDLLEPNIKADMNVTTYQDALELSKQVNRLEELQLVYQGSETEEALVAFNDANSKIAAMVGNIRLGSYADEYKGNYYSTDGGYIKTSFAKGFIILNANCFILDDDNYPMIVDTFKYKRAVEWYVIAQLCLQGYQHHEVNYRLADSKFEDFRQQASNEAKIFSRDKMDRFLERWTSIKRDISGVHVYDAL